MGDVDVTNIPPIDIEQVSNIAPVQIASISKIAPTAIHVKELNHVAPLTVESLQVAEVRNIDPVKVDRFDVTYLPTVNLTIGQAPQLDLNLRQIPPFAVGLHQDLVLPSEYLIRARFLGVEVLRLEVSGRTMMHPRDRVHREVSASHERSFREVAAVGNPAIPVTVRERSAEAVVREPAPARRPHRRRAPHPRAIVHAAGIGHAAGLRVNAHPTPLARPRPQARDYESAVSSL